MKNKMIIAMLVVSIAPAAFAQRSRSVRQELAIAGIHKIEELTADRIDAFDRERTIILLPVGMLEQHGPHLPIGSDSFGVEYGVNEVSKRIAGSMRGWNIIQMPSINYGEGGANEIGNIQIHPGTYGIRQTTLRSIVADVGGQLAQNRFKWIFVIHGHGSPMHNVAISEASDFVSETFNVTMLNLQSMLMADAAAGKRSQKTAAKFFTRAELAASGVDIHAGLSETSGVLAIRPGLVDKVYRSLPDRQGRTFTELRQIARSPGWKGYFSTPSKADARFGREDAQNWVYGLTNYIERAVRGENLFKHPRYPDQIKNDPAIIQIEKDSLENEKAFEKKLENWLKRRRGD